MNKNFDTYQLRRSLNQSSTSGILLKILRYGVMRIDVRRRSLGIASSDSLPAPDFLGIGAPKCGTTWLDRMLRNVPEIRLPERKELHFFDRGFDWTFFKYCSHFSAHSFCGEITPDYLSLSSPMVRDILRLLPSIKLVILLRDPLGRAWSQTKMELGLEQKRSTKDISYDAARACLLSKRCLMRSDYATSLSRWLKVTPRNQILIAEMNNIAFNPEDFFRKVLIFLDVPGIDVDLVVGAQASMLSERVFSGEPDPIPQEIRSDVSPVYDKLRVRANQFLKEEGFSISFPDSMN